MIGSRTIPDSRPRGIVWPGAPPPGPALVLALLCQFEHSQYWPGALLESGQIGQLGALIAHAAATCPFYGGRLEEAGRGAALTPEAFREAFRRIPFLTREDLQDNGEAMISTALPEDHGHTHETHSSGSTGRPVAVTVSSISGLYLRALNMRFHLWHRRDLNQKVAAITALGAPGHIASARTGAGISWGTGFKTGGMHYYDVTRPVSGQLDWLVRQDPAYLLTYPTNLRALLEASQSAGVRPLRLRDVSVMAEMVDPGLAGLCFETWGAPMAATYSSRETGIIAIQCGEGGTYHVQAESVMVEILDDSGAPCRPGETGRVVVTDLHNFAMPLIRYDIGDFAEIGETCRCGRTLPTLSRIRGRARNMLVLPSGGKIWPVPFRAAELAAIAPIRQIQMVQRSHGGIDVKLAVRSALAPEDEARLCSYFSEMLPYSLRFNLIYVDEIPRSSGGKFEDFISEVVA